MQFLKENVLSGIVTYNPEISRLKNCIDAVIGQANEVLIVDNGSDNIAEIEQILTDKIALIKWNENRGIAYALAQIMDYAIAHDYFWVLTVDQDSIIQDGLIEEYLKYTNRTECSNVGMFTCLIKDRNFQDNKHEAQSEELKKVDCCITSAAFCSTEKYRLIPGYDGSFFIDCVDFDICYQLREAGFDVCRINYLGILHEVGHGENRRFLLWKIVVYHHNAKRVYTIARNMVFLWKKHRRIFGLHRLIKKEMALFLRILLYETERREKFNSFFRGVLNGVRA